MTKEHAVVIGSGFGGLSAAAHLAHAGFRVTLLERNNWVGGRAKVISGGGFTFDTGPSWYWMPEEHDRWFRELGFDRRDFYSLTKLTPSYRIFFGDSEPGEPANIVDLPGDPEGSAALFDRYEPGAGDILREHLKEAQGKYELSMRNFVYKNYRSLRDMVNRQSLGNVGLLQMHRSFAGVVRSRFSHPFLRKILEFPVTFLGSAAERTPAVYTMLHYVDHVLGTWHPEGGYGRVAASMRQVCERLGVEFRLESEVTAIRSAAGKVERVEYRHRGATETLAADLVISDADYAQVELNLLSDHDRSISKKQWERKAISPTVMRFFLGFDKKLPFLKQHTFFFDTDWQKHFDAVYRNPGWVEKPLFYVHAPSVTDPSVAPAGHESFYVLIPFAPGLEDDAELAERYYNGVMDRIEELSGENLRKHQVFRQDIKISDFKQCCNAYKGAAFGLGQTLLQTAYFRPTNKSRKLDNLYYCGMYTTPGTGVTMSTISGVMTAQRILEERDMPATVGTASLAGTP